MVDGAVLVVKAGSTPYDLVKRAVDAIGPAKLLGVVLNRAHGALGKYGYRYSDYYHRVPDGVKGRRPMMRGQTARAASGSSLFETVLIVFAVAVGGVRAPGPRRRWI